jgi:hypothetical protein
MIRRALDLVAEGRQVCGLGERTVAAHCYFFVRPGRTWLQLSAILAEDPDGRRSYR